MVVLQTIEPLLKTKENHTKIQSLHGVQHKAHNGLVPQQKLRTVVMMYGCFYGLKIHEKNVLCGVHPTFGDVVGVTVYEYFLARVAHSSSVVLVFVAHT